jgi:hypothetical protein
VQARSPGALFLVTAVHVTEGEYGLGAPSCDRMVSATHPLPVTSVNRTLMFQSTTSRDGFGLVGGGGGESDAGGEDGPVGLSPAHAGRRAADRSTKAARNLRSVANLRRRRKRKSAGLPWCRVVQVGSSADTALPYDRVLDLHSRSARRRSQSHAKLIRYQWIAFGVLYSDLYVRSDQRRSEDTDLARTDADGVADVLERELSVSKQAAASRARRGLSAAQRHRRG